MRVKELAVMMDLSSEIGVILFGGFEYDLQWISAYQTKTCAARLTFGYLRAVCEFMSRQIHFSK
jgi:hypothetical protein